MFESILRHIGFNNVCCFNSAFDVIERLQTSEDLLPEFIFVDFLMPTMNGGQFLDLVNDIFPNNNIGFCIASGCSNLEEKDLRGSYFIPKPFSIDTVKNILDDFYKKKSV